MNRHLVCVAMTAAWMLWQEILLPQSHTPPSWQLEGGFSGEAACHEAREIRLIEQLLRSGHDGLAIINQPTVQEGTVWLQRPNGDQTRIRFFCLPETIDPREPWS
jgi:hypothetical protein